MHVLWPRPLRPAPAADRTPPSAARLRRQLVHIAGSPSSGTRSPCGGRRRSRSQKSEVSGHKLLLLLLWLQPPSSLLLVVLDEALGLAVLPLQGLILGLGLLQVLIHGLAETLRLHPVALQLLHALLVLLQRLLQLGLVQPPALLLLLSVVQLRTEGEERSKV